MRKYRRRGVSHIVAATVFEDLPCRWEVRQIPENHAAQIFWRDVIHTYTHGAYGEERLSAYGWPRTDVW